MNVVFTGPAKDAVGRSVLRQDLARAAQSMFMTVQNSFTKNADMLVASRVDTVKAQKAAKYGATVMTYPDFINIFLGGFVPHHKDSKADSYADAVEKQNDYVPVYDDGDDVL